MAPEDLAAQDSGAKLRLTGEARLEANLSTVIYMAFSNFTEGHDDMS